MLFYKSIIMKMNKFIKSIAAAATAAAIAVSSAGCADITTVGTIEGENIRAGVYLMYELQAMSEAYNEIDSQLSALGQSASDIENFNYFDYNVQEVPFSQFVEERTLGYIKRHVAIQKLFEEYGLELTETETTATKESIAEMWETEMTYYGIYSLGVTYGEYYEELGISRTSYQEIEFVDMMENKLFDKYYEENGITPTDESDIQTYFDDNYGRFQIIQVSLTEGDGSAIETDEGKAMMEDLANSYLTRLKNGENFNTVYDDYEAYVEEQERLAEEAEAAENGEDTDTETDDETNEVTTVGDSTAVVEDDDEDHDHEVLISKESTSPSEEFIKWAFDLGIDEGGLYKDETVYYVVMRKNLLDREDWFEKNRSSILHLMKDEEFEELLDSVAADYEVNLNSAALDAYKPDKIRQ